VSREEKDGMSLIHEAEVFATSSHSGQRRKYGNEAYICHPERVAREVSMVKGATPEMVAAAWLHDTVEDCGVALVTIRALFGATVFDYVRWLTHVYTSEMFPYLGRAERKRLEAARLAEAPAAAQTIKYADVIDNTASILIDDLEFAAVYTGEMRHLLGVCHRGDAGLRARAIAQVSAP
jgi:guanosine-3',5'-bis(diphosphate) 3'-pyrophosphohydrolase